MTQISDLGEIRVRSLLDIDPDLGRLILEKVRTVEETPFVGHVGGDDFVVVSDADHAEGLAKELCDAFDGRLASWYGHASTGVEATTRSRADRPPRS